MLFLVLLPADAFSISMHTHPGADYVYFGCPCQGGCDLKWVVVLDEPWGENFKKRWEARRKAESQRHWLLWQRRVLGPPRKCRNFLAHLPLASIYPSIDIVDIGMLACSHIPYIFHIHLHIFLTYLNGVTHTHTHTCALRCVSVWATVHYFNFLSHR